MNYNKFTKYLSDVFINPSKALALLFHPPAFILAGCAAFAIAETMHCSAHIRRAYEKEGKSRGWRAAKISLMLLRLTASWVGAVALSLTTVIGSTLVATMAAPVFPIAFFVSSCASLLHKLKGFYNHFSKPDTPGLWEHIQYFPTLCRNLFRKKDKATKTEKEISMDKSYQLAGRAVIGLTGTVLTAMLVLFKTAALVALASNPIGIAIGGAVLAGMVIYKAIKAYKEYNKIQHAPSPPSPAVSVTTDMEMSSSTAHLLKHSPRGLAPADTPVTPGSAMRSVNLRIILPSEKHQPDIVSTSALSSPLPSPR